MKIPAYLVALRRHVLTQALLPFALLLASAGAQAGELISLAMRDTELSEVIKMLSRQQRVNILLTGDTGGEVSFSLYDVELEQAIRSIAAAAGLCS